MRSGNPTDRAADQGNVCTCALYGGVPRDGDSSHVVPGESTLGTVTSNEIVEGLRSLGLNRGSSAIVHSSLQSFGHVEGGAARVCEALAATCGTILFPGSAWDLTGIVLAPPGLVRPNNARENAPDWQTFDAAVERARVFSPELPVDRELGAIPESARKTLRPLRSAHPLFSYLAVGSHASNLLAGQRLDWPLGPIDVLERLDGHVLLLGVDHTSNTAIHLAEQRLGRSRFWRYAKVGDGVWGEFPNLPGDSEGFADIEPLLPAVAECRIGECRARLYRVREVIAVARALILDDPAALLGDVSDPACRDGAAYRQRLATIDAGTDRHS